MKLIPSIRFLFALSLAVIGTTAASAQILNSDMGAGIDTVVERVIDAGPENR